jgi:hypothetical protein
MALRSQSNQIETPVLLRPESSSEAGADEIEKLGDNMLPTEHRIPGAGEYRGPLTLKYKGPSGPTKNALAFYPKGKLFKIDLSRVINELGQNPRIIPQKVRVVVEANGHTRDFTLLKLHWEVKTGDIIYYEYGSEDFRLHILNE